MSENTITLESRPVEILVEIESIFMLLTMESYGRWMSNLTNAILGKSYTEAARTILTCYAGAGSLLDVGIGLQPKGKPQVNKRFYYLRDELYEWANQRS